MWDLKEYRFASSAAEAVALMRKGPGKGAYIAGGTDIYLDLPDCDFVVDINHAGLGDIARTPAGDLFLGAATSLQNIVTNDLVASFGYGAISNVANHCGNRPVRSTATIGGNLCNGLPSADMAPVLLALDAMCYIIDEDCQESLPLSEFFLGPRKTVLDGRLLVGLAMPAEASTWHCLTHKVTRSAEDISLVQVAVALGIEDGVVVQARIALGAVSPIPMRASLAEAMITGMEIAKIDNDVLVDVGVIASGECDPIDDHRATAEYRRELVSVWTKRLVAKALSWENNDTDGSDPASGNEGGAA
jgi:carbon-monoxide dehydrogenase medium subunit